MVPLVCPALDRRPAVLFFKKQCLAGVGCPQIPKVHALHAGDAEQAEQHARGSATATCPTSLPAKSVWFS